MLLQRKYDLDTVGLTVTECPLLDGILNDSLLELKPGR